MRRFISVCVYRSPLGDSTNNGVTSSNFDYRMLVEHERGHISEAEGLNCNDVILVAGEAGGQLHFKPEGAKGWTMAGGNFVYSSDSRFSEKYSRQPVSVHDRIEY